MCVVDIFARLPDGSPMWIGSAENLGEARERIRELNRTNPSDYFLYSELNGQIQREDHPNTQ